MLDAPFVCRNIHKHDQLIVADFLGGNIPMDDQEILKGMIKTRKKRAALQPAINIADEVIAVTGKAVELAAPISFDSLLTYAKYRTP